jgi:hypothetical protein
VTTKTAATRRRASCPSSPDDPPWRIAERIPKAPAARIAATTATAKRR